MYPQGVCRIRKPAYAGNGCAIFLVFQTEDVGQKSRLRLADTIARCCLKMRGKKSMESMGFLPRFYIGTIMLRIP